MGLAGIVSIGGELMAPEEARISIFDRGFLYGDSVYETMRVYGGTPFALSEHLGRLERSGQLVAFELPWDETAMARSIDRALTAAGLEDAYLRVIATRGSGTLGLDPALAENPQLIIIVLPLPPLPPDLYTRGRRASLVDVRRNLKQALNPQAKTGNYMNSVLAVHAARQRSADEAIMLDVDGRVAEASSANVFALLGGVWTTPPLDVGILAGITRDTVLALCRRLGPPASERVIWPDDLRAAEAIFLCGTVRELVPIVSLDDEPVGTGTVGESFQRLLDRYRRYVRDASDDLG